MKACPACRSGESAVVREYTAEQSASHLIPRERDAARHDQLVAELRELFGGDTVRVLRCQTCGFCHADPFVAGTASIYNLVTQGIERYPRDRFEFGETLAHVEAGDKALLELGAGDGAFLRRAAPRLRGRVWATEYVDGSLARLRAIDGVEAHKLSPQQLAATGPEPFDFVCMFQVLEHLDRLDDVFSALAALLVPGGELFISVPNADSVTAQERMTGYWEMPPNHVGRWTRPALEAIAGRHGLEVVDHRLEPVRAVPALWEMATYRCQARAYDGRSLPGRVNALGFRPIRGTLKRMLAGWDFLYLLPQIGKVPPRSQWFRLRKQV